MHFRGTFGVPEPELEPVQRALAQAGEVADLWAGDRSGLADNLLARQADLAEAVEDLRAARRPLTAYTRRMPDGHTVSDDPAYRLNVEVGRTLKRLADLRRRSVVERPKGGRRPRVPARDLRSLRGSLQHAARAAADVRAQVEAARRVSVTVRHFTASDGGRSVQDTAELRREAEEGLATLAKLRANVDRAWAAYVRHTDARMAAARVATRDEAETPGDVRTERDTEAARVSEVRATLCEVQAQLEAVLANPTPAPSYRRLTMDDLADLWERFHSAYGRWPTKRDCDTLPGLPAYRQVKRIIDRLTTDTPLVAVVKYVDDVRARYEQ